MLNFQSKNVVGVSNNDIFAVSMSLHVGDEREHEKRQGQTGSGQRTGERAPGGGRLFSPQRLVQFDSALHRHCQGGFSVCANLFGQAATVCCQAGL